MGVQRPYIRLVLTTGQSGEAAFRLRRFLLKARPEVRKAKAQVSTLNWVGARNG
jgi:hypothetical protein